MIRSKWQKQKEWLLPLRWLLFWFGQWMPLLLLLFVASLVIRGVLWAIHFDWLPHLRPQKIEAMIAAIAGEMMTLLPIWWVNKRLEPGLWPGFLLVLTLIPVTVGLIFVSLAWEM